MQSLEPSQNPTVTLKRAVSAMLIPSGENVTLAEGAKVCVEFRLGGNFTVRGAFGLARIAGKDFDALGEPRAPEVSGESAHSGQPEAADGVADKSSLAKSAPQPPETSPSFANADTQPEKKSDFCETANEANHKFPMPSKDDLWNVAKTVYDPEIPVNVVDLGLIYKLEPSEESSAEGKIERVVNVDMTLTAPGCALGPMIADDLKSRLESVPGIDRANVQIVWNPPWNQDMISEEGRMILGLV